MNDFLKTLLSLSLSGALLTALTACLYHLLRKQVPKRFLYYLWLLVLLRFLCPIGTEWSLTHHLVSRSWSAPVQTAAVPVEGGVPIGERTQEEAESASPPQTLKTDQAPADERVLGPEVQTPAIKLSLSAALMVAWAAGAIIVLVRRLTGYFRLNRKLQSETLPVWDWEQNLYQSLTAQDRRPPPLRRSAAAAAPMLAGLLRPVIYLPAREMELVGLGYALRHELIHWRRHDLLYKWGLTMAACVHWFNPAVWYLAHTTDQICELSCDEAVIQGLSTAARAGYGNMLLEAAAYQCRMSGVLSASLWNQKNNLKERLYGIMRPTLNSKKAKYLFAAAVVVVAVTSVALGAYALRSPVLSPIGLDQPGDAIFCGENGLALDREGEQDTVLITRDGGRSWAALPLPEAVYDQDGQLTADPETWTDAPLRVLADLPEADITLYDVNLDEGLDRSGFLLRRGAHLDLFPNLSSSTGPRMILSDMALADYDGDGTEELAVRNCTETGTGVSAHHLYLFEETPEGGFELGAALTEEDLFAQVEQNISGIYDPASFSYTIRIAGGTYLCDLSSQADWLAETTVGELTPSWYFDYDLEPLQVSILLRPVDMPMCDVVEYTAGIVYDGSTLTLNSVSGGLKELPGYPLVPVSEMASDLLIWPFEPEDDKIVLSALYGEKIHPITGEVNRHDGIDIPLAQGVPVLAAASGVVAQSGYDSTRGNYVALTHGDVSTLYCHMETLLVSAGETVTAGQQIGTVGTTGASTGSHLHFETAINGSNVDPLYYLPQKAVYVNRGDQIMQLE